jgi:uncharacterized Zn finger protein
VSGLVEQLNAGDMIALDRKGYRVEWIELDSSHRVDLKTDGILSM